MKVTVCTTDERSKETFEITGFTKKVVNRLCVKENITTEQAIFRLAELGAKNTPRFMF